MRGVLCLPTYSEIPETRILFYIPIHTHTHMQTRACTDGSDTTLYVRLSLYLVLALDASLGSDTDFPDYVYIPDRCVLVGAIWIATVARSKPAVSVHSSVCACVVRAGVVNNGDGGGGGVRARERPVTCKLQRMHESGMQAIEPRAIGNNIRRLYHAR